MNRHHALWLIQRLVFKVSNEKILLSLHRFWKPYLKSAKNKERKAKRRKKKVFVSKEGVVREVE